MRRKPRRANDWGGRVRRGKEERKKKRERDAKDTKRLWNVECGTWRLPLRGGERETETGGARRTRSREVARRRRVRPFELFIRERRGTRGEGRKKGDGGEKEKEKPGK